MRFCLQAVLIVLGSFGTLGAQQQGMTPRWEIIEITEHLSESAKDIQAILSQVRPKDWAREGAPDAYVAQNITLQSDLANLELSAQALRRKPEKLSVAIDTFLWLDRVGSMLRSLTAAVRKYQNPGLGDLLASAGNRATTFEETLKGYLRQLAVERETELEISHNEAQRCRGTLVRQPRSR